MQPNDVHPFHLRMPQELRNAIDREAKINGRSLNMEIVDRLRRSFENSADVHTPNQTVAGFQSHPMSDLERQILTMVIQRLTPERQLALISLFR